MENSLGDKNGEALTLARATLQRPGINDDDTQGEDAAAVLLQRWIQEARNGALFEATQEWLADHRALKSAVPSAADARPFDAMEFLRDMNAAVNLMVAMQPSLPWTPRAWEELPEVEKQAMAKVIAEVFPRYAACSVQDAQRDPCVALCRECKSDGICMKLNPKYQPKP